MGEIDLTGSLSEEPNNNSNRTVVGQQPLLGSLYKSQNSLYLDSKSVRRS